MRTTESYVSLTLQDFGFRFQDEAAEYPTTADAGPVAYRVGFDQFGLAVAVSAAAPVGYRVGSAAAPVGYRVGSVAAPVVHRVGSVAAGCRMHWPEQWVEGF